MVYRVQGVEWRAEWKITWKDLNAEIEIREARTGKSRIEAFFALTAHAGPDPLDAGRGLQA